MTIFVYPLVISLLSAGLACASLYPTQPVANTVFTGGTNNIVTWIDSDAVPGPSLSQLGRLQIDMWVDDVKRIAILATDVDPVLGSLSVFIPSHVWGNAENCVLRFKSFNPPATIYTADFTITNMTGDRAAHLLRESLSNSGALTSLSTSVSTSSSSMPDGGNNDLVTVTREMSDSNSASSPDPTSVGAVAAMANSASNGGRHVRRPNIQFNFVFVLLPSLFGLALAL